MVFDGWKGGAGSESVSTRGGVRIIYSRLGEKADSVIKRIVSTDKRQWIVVSSDREVASHAWSNGSVPVPSEEFLPLLEALDAGGLHSGGDVQSSEGNEDEGTSCECRKGNPHTPSRKEKALKRALGKL